MHALKPEWRLHRLLVVLVGLFLATAAFGATVLPPKGQQPLVITPQEKVIPLYDSSYALVISVAKYIDAETWPVLDNTKTELDTVTEKLRLHGFEVHRVVDPTGDQLAREIKTFMNSFGRKRNSRIVVLYSGHGYLDKETGSGYLVPVDATSATAPNSNFFNTAYAMEDLRTEALRMPAKHGLFIFDSCYSGMVFKGGDEQLLPRDRGKSISDRWRYIEQNSADEVRQFISAGGADQRLPGKSAFVTALLQGLDGGASRTDDGYVTGKELGLFIRQQVSTISRTQKPQSDALGKVLGDMVFQFRKDSVLVQAARPSIPIRVPNTGPSNTPRSSATPDKGPPEPSDEHSRAVGTPARAATPKTIDATEKWVAWTNVKFREVEYDFNKLVKFPLAKQDVCLTAKLGLNGKILLAQAEDGMGFFDTESGQLLKTLKLPSVKAPGTACFIFDDKLFANGDQYFIRVREESAGKARTRHLTVDLRSLAVTEIRVPDNESLLKIAPNADDNEIVTVSMSDSPAAGSGGPHVLKWNETPVVLHIRLLKGDGSILKSRDVPTRTMSDLKVARQLLDDFEASWGMDGMYSRGYIIGKAGLISLQRFFEGENLQLAKYSDIGCGPRSQLRAVLLKVGSFPMGFRNMDYFPGSVCVVQTDGSIQGQLRTISLPSPQTSLLQIYKVDSDDVIYLSARKYDTGSLFLMKYRLSDGMVAGAATIRASGPVGTAGDKAVTWAQDVNKQVSLHLLALEGKVLQ
jgi:hypothetical protein